MSPVSTTVTGLGIPDVDGVEGIIDLPSGVREFLRWNLAQQAWVGRAHPSMHQVDNVGMRSDGDPNLWKYPGDHIEIPNPRLGTVQFGFQIHKLLDAYEFWAAGLRLQEHLAVEMKGTSGLSDANPEIALAWYNLTDGENFLSPLSYNNGVRVSGNKDIYNYRWFSSGWQNTLIEQPPQAGDNWYPEIYLLGPQASFRNFTARHRWVAGTVGGVGGSDQASKYPPLDDIFLWNRASSIPLIDGATVSEWPDFSGRGFALSQSTLAKRPVIRRDGVGQMRHVRFDGVDDILRSVAITAQPITIFLVLRQNVGGGVQQVWAGNNAAGAPLIYRGDATDQVNVWANAGSDLIYHRAAPWPMPFTIWSAVINGASTNIWEGLTQVSAGDPGASGFGAGIVIGNNHAESLPAKIDIAEIIVSFKAAFAPERTAVINYLDAEYNIL